MTLSKLLIGLTALACTLAAKANILISLDRATQTINAENPLTLDLVISGLGDHASPSLGGFAFDLNFNPAILSAVSVAFGNDLDLGIARSFQFSELSTPGLIHVEEVSFEDPSVLNANQPSSFKLASLILRTLGGGTSPVTISNGSLSDENGTSLEFQTLAAEIKVIGRKAVPDAGSSLLLAGIGLAGIWGLRRTPLGSALH